MDLIEQAKIEYEYFKLAKRLENFSFRCHFLEVEINRIIALISAFNNKISTFEDYQNFEIRIPYEIYNVDTELHWEYYVKYRKFISKCHSNPEIEWINPISMSNQMESDITDAEQSLEGLSLATSLCILKVMLMNLMDEAVSIEEEGTAMLKAHNNPSSSGVDGFLKPLSRFLEDNNRISLEMIKDAEIAGDNEEAARLKELFLKSPFQRIYESIQNVLIPQVDAILSSL